MKDFRYIKFAMKYCDHKRLFTIDNITKKKVYDPCDLWEGILALHDHENRNRRKAKV